MSKQTNSEIYDQVGISSDGVSFENQYLKISAIDGDYGTFYQLDTKNGKWSFTDESDILIKIKSFINKSEGLR